MAKNEELFTCSICLQLMEKPVTIGCGHSYCMICIDTFWDRKCAEQAFSCPQCRQTFEPRPVLNRNALLAELLEEYINSSTPDATDYGATVEGTGDVLCDACVGEENKACKFCLICLASYCEAHLKPHFEVPPLKKHKLVQASASNKKAICGRHYKLLEIYCRTDSLFICVLCVLDGHKGHDTVAVIEEKCAIEKQLERRKQEVLDRMADSERKMTELRKAENSIKGTAWEVCDEFERLCMENVRFYVLAMEKRCAEVREKVGEAEKAGVGWTNSQLGQLRSEVCALRKRDEQLAQLLLTEEPIAFLQGCQTLGDLPSFNDVHTKFGGLTEFVNDQKHKLKNVCNKEKEDLCSTLTKITALSLATVPREQHVITSRGYFLSNCNNHKLEVDSNTVAGHLSLSNSNRELSWGASDQAHPDHIDRFTYYSQALCKQGLSNDTYWEVEWDGGIVEVAVAYRGIQRKGSGNECCFGHNNFSWKLVCSPSGCKFWHNNLERAPMPPVKSRKLGVYLSYQAGILYFYSINNSNVLAPLHKIQAIFTEPLYAGFSVDLGSTLKICNI